MATSRRSSKWLPASIVFSVVGAVLIVGILWAARGRAPGTPPGDPPPREESVAFQAGDNKLAATLVLPGTPGPHPAIVFVGAGGPADRTGDGLFASLWHEFARRGFASLAWDRPGVGSSTGDHDTQTFADRADELRAAVRFLRSRSDIQADRVGALGFDQGGTALPLAAADSSEIAFVVVVSGSQVPVWQQELYRIEAELRADGFKTIHIKEAVQLTQMRVDLMRNDGLYEEFDETQKGLSGRPWFEYLRYCDRKRFEAGRQTVSFDPAPLWEQVRCPVLAIYGDKDTACPVEPSIAVLKERLEKGGNREVTIKVFAGAGHRLTVAQTGGRKEAEQQAKSRPAGSPPDFAPGYVATMTDWLSARFSTK